MKKNKKTELDVDVIGGLGSLTAKEEKELNDFFRQRKLRRKKRRSSKRSKENS